MSVGQYEYETTRLRLDRFQTRGAVRQLLAQHAEYGGWELARLRRCPDGTRLVWLRRRIIRVLRTPEPRRRPDRGRLSPS